MKKRMFFWMLALMICAAGCADSFTEEPQLPTQEASHEVTQAEARQSLEKIVFDLKIPSTRGGEPRCVPPITSVYSTGRAAEATRSGEEIEPYFHIFNFGRDEGFAIMSGDDRVEPLLALTFKGEFTPETEIDNPGFEIAYSRMEDYYVQRVATYSPDDARVGILPDSMPGKDQIGFLEGEPFNVYYEMPLGHCPVKWGQTGDYNRYCFTTDGLEAYTGCVATAVAQLMAIYKYPSGYNGYTFNWNDMISSSPSATGVDQIARLMQQLGLPHNLNMNYGAVIYNDGSGANPNNIPHTLENFGYTDGGSLVSYNTVVVATELKAGYPVLIGGRTNDDKGHRWLGHGIMEHNTPSYMYDTMTGIILETLMITDTYILCNLGWSGSADGYYLSGIFNTIVGPAYPENNTSSSNGSSNYNNTITVVKGIRR